VNNPKFGVQFQLFSGRIDAGRLGTEGQRTIFKDKCDVTDYAIWAVAQWLDTHSPSEPYEMYSDPESGRGYRITVEKMLGEEGGSGEFL
jgi:hypothetical protein